MSRVPDPLTSTSRTLFCQSGPDAGCTPCTMCCGVNPAPSTLSQMSIPSKRTCTRSSSPSPLTSSSRNPVPLGSEYSGDCDMGTDVWLANPLVHEPSGPVPHDPSPRPGQYWMLPCWRYTMSCSPSPFMSPRCTAGSLKRIGTPAATSGTHDDTAVSDRLAVSGPVHVAEPKLPSPPGKRPSEKNVCISVPLARTTSTSPSQLTSNTSMSGVSSPRSKRGSCCADCGTARPTMNHPPLTNCGVYTAYVFTAGWCSQSMIPSP